MTKQKSAGRSHSPISEEHTTMAKSITTIDHMKTPAPTTLLTLLPLHEVETYSRDEIEHFWLVEGGSRYR